MKLRLVIVSVALTALAAPSAAGAQVSLTTDRSCYFAREKTRLIDTEGRVGFIGTGFTPNGGVFLGQIPIMANAVGAFSKALPSPEIPGKQKDFPAIAVDRTNPALRDTVTARLTKLRLKISRRVSKTARLRIRARGFFAGKNLYAHVRRGKRYRKNIKIGRVRKPCGLLNKKRRLFGRSAPFGRYRIQFDNKRRYRKSTQPKAVFRVRVVRRASRASAAASSGPLIEPLSFRAR